MRFGRQGLAGVGAACVLWLSLGALAVTGPDTALRVGVLSPIWAGLLLLALGVGAAILVRAHESLSLLWLPAVLLLLPWLPFVVPAAFLLWTGPCAALIWAALIVALFMRVPRGSAGSWPAAVARPVRSFFQTSFQVREAAAEARPPRRVLLAAGAIAAALYLCAAWQVSDFLPAGDEPHYLVIADSLLHDGDLKIENNHRAHQYLPYFEGELKPDFLRRSANGQIYSIHAPGLPLLVLPAYAIAGVPGAAVFLALLSAAGAALAWRLCFLLTGRASAAWFGWAVAALPIPALFHAFTFYPDGAGAVIALTGAAALIEADRLSVRRAALHGLALAWLPWLHTRFVLIAAAFGIAIALRLIARPARVRLLAAFLAVPIASAVAWFSYFYVIYGTPDPSAPYGRYTQSALSHVPVGLTGLLFDQQFGVMVNAPVYLIGLCGLGWLAFRGGRRAGPSADPDGPGDRGLRRLAIELTAVIVPYTIAAAMYGMWWGGWSAPARFLVAVLPLLALPAAIAWARARTQTTRVSAMSALGISAWLSLSLMIVRHGRLVYNDRDGFALWTDWANRTIDLSNGLPSLFRMTWLTALVYAEIWIGAIVATWITLRAIELVRARTRPVSASEAWAAAAFGYAIAAMAALSVIWWMTGVSGLRPNLSQLALLPKVYTGSRDLGVVYEGGSGSRLLRPRLLRAGSIPEHLHIETMTRRLPRERPFFIVSQLPAGRYRVAVTPAGGPGSAEGRLDVVVGRSGAPLLSFDIAPPATASSERPHGASDFELTFPVAIDTLSIHADERARQSVARVALVPIVAYDPRSGLPPDGNPFDVLPGVTALRTVRYGEAIVYSTSPAIYLEPNGLWIQPDADVALVIDKQPAPTTFSVLLRNGPNANRVRVSVESWQREVTLPPGGEEVVEVPASRRGATALRLFAAEGFRPSALDPKNGDHRRLGVWMELR